MTRRTVTLYSQPDCPPCHWIRHVLDARGIAYELKDVSADFGALREMVARYNSRSTPTLVVGDEVMVGYDPDRLERMLAE